MIERRIEINLNDRVLVKLNASGLAKHRENWELTFPEAYKRAHPYKPPRVDADGRTSYALWALMQEQGSAIVLGLEPPFHTSMVLLQDVWEDACLPESDRP